ncbi:MAG: DNA circularization N-terminal domain-containing protein [Actinomycetota bacterium]
MPAKPMLDDIELQLVQDIEAEDEEALAQHGVTALEGDFLQDLGRRASRVRLTGVMIGDEVADALKKLRDKFRAAEPVSFVADIATATKVHQVLINEMSMRALAGKPERFEYALTLREFLPQEEPMQEQAAPVDSAAIADGQQQAQQVVEEIAENVGRLEVTVTLAGDRQDFTGVVVLFEGQTESGERVTLLLEEQANGVFRRDDVPAGNYTFTAFRR